MARTWAAFIDEIPPWHFEVLYCRRNRAVTKPLRGVSTEGRLELLGDAGVDLAEAQALYAALGGDEGVDEVNRTPTNFTALRPELIRKIALHAQWQTIASHA